jgi:hypothetical protein
MDKKYHIIKSFHNGHIYYREQYTNKIAIGDQSCIDRENNILPPTASDDHPSTGVCYIDFDRVALRWELAYKKDPEVAGRKIYQLPLIGERGQKFSSPISETERQWLIKYF